MEKFDRAERRKQVARLKKKRKGYYGYDRPHTGPNEMTERELGRVVQYPASCSCMMCGNARKWFGDLTIQEQRLKQDVDE